MAYITAQTLNFLQDLKANNQKSWFEQNRDRYEQSQAEMTRFAEEVMRLMAGFDVLETQSGKKSLYRIYRDIRFSKDKTPYKTFRSGYFRRSGAERRGGYVFHIEPENTYISGGFYGPNKEDLRLIRQQIAQDAQPLRSVLAAAPFREYFGKMLGEQLKTAPQGFDKAHPEIDLLRYKQFIIQHDFTNEEVLAADFEEKVAKGFSKMLPFFQAMTEYLTTNLNGESLLEN